MKEYTPYFVIVNLDINRYLMNNYDDGSDDYWSGNVKDAKLFLTEDEAEQMLIMPEEDDFDPFWEILSKVKNYEIKKIWVR